MADGDPAYMLILCFALAMIGLVVAVIRDRSAGAERRDRRQRHARKRARAERRVHREIEKTMPRATVAPPREPRPTNPGG
ncbi:MAG TPA: hypothetical protein VIV11_06030 [Kofleriaceae bacterium]